MTLEEGSYECDEGNQHQSQRTATSLHSKDKEKYEERANQLYEKCPSKPDLSDEGSKRGCIEAAAQDFSQRCGQLQRTEENPGKCNLSYDIHSPQSDVSISLWQKESLSKEMASDQ
jgi:hypothetical protein